MQIDKTRYIISIYFKILRQADKKAYPCQRQCSLFTQTAADPQFTRFHSLAEIFAKNIKTVVTSCTCQGEKKPTNKIIQCILKINNKLSRKISV